MPISIIYQPPTYISRSKKKRQHSRLWCFKQSISLSQLKISNYAKEN